MDIEKDTDLKYQQYLNHLNSIIESSNRQIELNWNPINFESLQKNMLIRFTYTSRIGHSFTVCGHLAALSINSTKFLADWISLVEEPVPNMYDCSRITDLYFRWDDTDLGL